MTTLLLELIRNKLKEDGILDKIRSQHLEMMADLANKELPLDMRMKTKCNFV